RIGVIALTNADDGNPLLFVDKALEWVAPAIAAPSRPPATPPVGRDWSAYVGRYRSEWGDAQVLVHGGGLVVVDPSLPDPMATLTRLVPVGPHSFRMETSDGFGSHMELAVFELGPDGRAVRLRRGENDWEPVATW